MRTRGGRAVPPSAWVIVAFWIVAIVSTVVPFAMWVISRVISVDTEVTEELRAKVVEVVNKRPVHRTLESSAVVVTSEEVQAGDGLRQASVVLVRDIARVRLAGDPRDCTCMPASSPLAGAYLQNAR